MEKHGEDLGLTLGVLIVVEFRSAHCQYRMALLYRMVKPAAGSELLLVWWTEALDLPDVAIQLHVARRAGIDAQLKRMREALTGELPVVEVGPHCDEPYECPFKSRCWEPGDRPASAPLPREPGGHRVA